MSFVTASTFPYTAEINNRNNLSIGGCDVVELAKEFGTPLYVFDEVTLRRKCQEFLNGFRDVYQNSSVIYASKAFVNVPIAQLMKEEGLGIDVVSGGELAVAQRAQFPANNIYFHGNNKSRDELAMALKYGVGRIVVDNFHELDLLSSIADDMGIKQDILLRVSPGIDPHTHAYTTTGVLDSKFGFPIQTGDAAKAVELASASANLNIIGLHFHLGSPIFELDPYTKAMELTLEFANEIGLPIQEISPGGGFAISYTRDQYPPSIEQYATAISAPLSHFKNIRLVVEPGRAIVGRSGVAIYSVGSSKDIPGVRKYVSIDGGMGDNIRPALYQAQYEAVVANKMKDEDLESVSIAGKFCESGDILLRDVLFPRLEPDDILAIPAAGAYAPSMASNYNLVPRPAIVMVKDGHTRYLRYRETYDDLMRNDTPL